MCQRISSVFSLFFFSFSAWISRTFPDISLDFIGSFYNIFSFSNFINFDFFLFILVSLIRGLVILFIGSKNQLFI